MGKSTSKLSISHLKQEDVQGPTKDLDTVPARLEFYAKKCPDREAIVFASTDGERETISFAEIYQNSLQVARAFIKLGIKPKEFVAISLRPCPEWLYVAFGAMIAGARPFGAHFAYTDGSDFVALMDKLETCTCIVMDPGFENENWNIMSKLIDDISPDGKVTYKRIPSPLRIIAHRPCDGMSDLRLLRDLMDIDYGVVVFPEIQGEDIAFLFQTSGSTGCPKLVAHPHRSIASSLDFDADDVYSSDDIYFSDMPFEWVGGFPFSLCIGQKRITCSGFCPPPQNKGKFAVDNIRKENCNMIAGLPPILAEIVNRKDEFPKNWQAKGVFTAGLPITKRIFSEFASISKRFIVGYASSEHFAASINVVDDCDKFIDYDCGPAIPGVEIKVIDDEGNTVPIGTRGEIYIKSKRMFNCYINDAEKTKAVFSPDGWYKTEDVGRMLENGSLLVEGRKSNIINSGGFNAIPEILENMIIQVPGVEGVVLVPIPDEKLYQVVCACFKVTKGSDVNENTIRKFCEDSHGDKQGIFVVLPKYYLAVDSFPMTGTGKVSRKALAELAKETLHIEG